jgi:two-component system sensor histidine kinase BaeS
MSIRWRILGAFLLVILLTVIVGFGFDYWSGAKELTVFSTKIRTESLADVLSKQYTEDGGWENLEDVLKNFGATIDPEKIKAANVENDDLIAWFFWRVVVKDVNGDTLVDTFNQIEQPPTGFQLQGEPAVIRNIDTGEEVGTVTIVIDEDYVNAESRKFLISILYSKLLQGLITAIIAMGLGVWFSRRITTPIIALTAATQAIAQRGETHLLPVNSADELGQMSTSFNQMMTSLETQQELRKRLINDVAHELNTPLSVIRLEAKGLKDGIKHPNEAADQIIGEVDMLSNLVYDLDWLAETDSGNLRLNIAPHAFDQLLKTEVERWQLPAQAAKVALDLLPLLPDLPPMELDVVRISQALGNLIQNGLQFTPAGGRVTVMCRMEDDWLKTTVTDTGPGISEADLPHLFERFYRIDPSRQRAYGGRGLGLAIVKQIVEAHGGAVSAKSKIDKGSCFIFQLPISGLVDRNGH